MKRYKNLTGNSGVLAYENGVRFIKIQFNTGGVYIYSYKKAGKVHVENMKALAQSGKGLSSYISKYVKNLYD